MGGVSGAACLAGCASDDPGEGDDDADDGDDDADGDDELPGSDDGGDGTGDDAGGTRPEGTGGPGVSLVSTDGDVGLPVDLDVEVVREAATTDYPPRLRTTVTNTSDGQVRVGEGRAVHFEYVSDGSGALTFLPPEVEAPAEPDCWRLTDTVAVTEEYRTFELGPGESRSRPIDLYATHDQTDACLPVGEYRFETTASVVSDDAEPQSSAQWGFAVTLE
ncbi:hypothetical protein GCM10008994_09510 [Halorubrum ejinorense]|uniref:Intracellular proteinase inhibitor BsuPI domain-containing protein n=1 Tax=Halorubrum ejinorense TaxID=425309 RepID=A0AAV3SR28_9EURY